MKRCNPPYHPKKTDDGFVVMDVDRGMLAKGPMSAAKAIEAADEMNQPFLKEKDMELQVSNNPELLTVGLNPGRKKRRYSVRARKSRSRRRNPRRRSGIMRTYRGKKYKGFLSLMHKFGKTMARKIWNSGKKIGHNPSKKRKGKKSNWMALVKRYGVKGAMKHRRGR